MLISQDTARFRWQHPPITKRLIGVGEENKRNRFHRHETLYVTYARTALHQPISVRGPVSKEVHHCHTTSLILVESPLPLTANIFQVNVPGNLCHLQIKAKKARRRSGLYNVDLKLERFSESPLLYVNRSRGTTR